MIDKNDKKNTQPKKEVDVKHLIVNVVGIVLCVILLPILIFNCVLLVKGMLNEKEVPAIGKVIPLIVITESMEPDILGGDLIVVNKVDAQTLKEGDVIAFFDPAGNGTSIVTHKIKEVIYNDGDGSIKEFKTYGINNFSADGSPEIDRVHVPVGDVVGIYNGFRIPYLGSVAMFMQTTVGLLVCIGIPLALFIAYEVIRRRKADKANQNDINALMAELEALKQAKQTEALPEDQLSEGENNSSNGEE